MGEAPPDDQIVDLTLLVGDFSGSESERYDLVVGPIRHQATEFGQVESDDYRFKKGETHEVQIVHRGTRPDLIGQSGYPDYDYSADISPASGETDLIIIEDPDDILRLNWFAGDDPELGGPFYAEGKTAYLHLPLVDLDIVNPAVPDEKEETPGGFVLFNNDDDNENEIADYIDHTNLLGEGNTIAAFVNGEDDLVVLELRSLLPERLQELPGMLTLTFTTTTLRIWKEGGSGFELVVSGESFDMTEDHTLYVEGISGTSEVVDIVAKYVPGELGEDFTIFGTEATDTIRLTVGGIDLDIDSDNNNGFGLGEGTDWEETLEDNPYGLGKLIMLDNARRDFTPIALKLAPNLDPDDPNIMVKIDWEAVSDAGFVRLWNRHKHDPQRNNAPIQNGGSQVNADVEYSLADLRYDPETGEIILFAEGVAENELRKTLAGVEAHGKPDERIKATLVINGTDRGSDEVKYIVANEDSFFYHLQTRQEVRNELASRAVYGRLDRPNFSLKRLDEQELLDLGIQQAIVDLLLSDAVHGIAGFSAVLYQDFITGEDQYVLTFAGTDDAIWENEWDDWVNNVAQAFGFAAEQYEKAMEIGDAIRQIPDLLGNVITTGHSLGGGLASAAAVVSGMPAHTFNAAGLHIDTLYQRDINGDPIPNGMGGYFELYAGSVARYNNADAFITAYYVDHDILSAVQDYTPIPNALGVRRLLDGPFDMKMSGNAVAFGVAMGLGHGWAATLAGLSALLTMIESHGHPSILYGMLVEEGLLGLGFELDVLGYDAYF